MSFPRLGVGGVERGPLATALIGGSLIVTGMYARTPWWTIAIVVITLAVPVGVQVQGRTPVRWMRDWAHYRFGRSARALALAEVSHQSTVYDTAVPAGVCGVEHGGSTLVAMIELAPNLDLPTVIAEKTLYTEDTLPVTLLTSALDQFGIGIDIDIVTTGQRVRSPGSYGKLYDQLIGSHPVVGDRLSWLVLRLDAERNLPALSRRGKCADTAPTALATAAFRIAQRLRERGIAAQVLPAEAMNTAIRELHSGVEPVELRETWSQLETSVPGRSITSFSVDWSRMSSTGLDECWTWGGGRTTLVVSLTGAGSGPRALVRYVGPELKKAKVPGFLRRLPGQQAAALLATLPTRISAYALPEVGAADHETAWAAAEQLAVPIGPNGQILGSVNGPTRATLAMPLFDPSRYNPRRRTIDVQAHLPVAQQLILRTTAMGASVAVHTNRPRRWERLIAAVGHSRALWLAGGAPQNDPGVEPAVAVFDQLPPQTGAASTTMAVTEPGGPRRRAVDLAIEQVNASTVEVRMAMRTVRVELVSPRGETRYLDFTEPAAPQRPAEEGPPAQQQPPAARSPAPRQAAPPAARPAAQRPAVPPPAPRPPVPPAPPGPVAAPPPGAVAPPPPMTRPDNRRAG